MQRKLWNYSMTEKAVEQRIRDWARRQKLEPMRRGGKWYFGNYSNLLVSPETGLDDEEALDYLAQQ